MAASSSRTVLASRLLRRMDAAPSAPSPLTRRRLRPFPFASTAPRSSSSALLIVQPFSSSSSESAGARWREQTYKTHGKKSPHNSKSKNSSTGGDVSAGNVYDRKWSKSPHSKILRVCSERNSNPHFAAIEADMLRLDWKESMSALVDDWSARTQWDHFIELEDNVRSYVFKNLVDLKYYESECVNEWEWDTAKGNGSDGIPPETSSAVSLEDHLRFHLFPYERVINGAIYHAIAGKVRLSSVKRAEVGRSKEKAAMAELDERIGVLANAGRLLEAMAKFEGGATVEQVEARAKEEKGGGDDDDDDDDGFMEAMARFEGLDNVLKLEAQAKEEEDSGDDDGDGESEDAERDTPKTPASVWTRHHDAISDAHRTLLSGWFLLHRRVAATKTDMVQTSSAKDVLAATDSRLDVHPERELLRWTDRWIDLCTAGNEGFEDGAAEGGDEIDRRGILSKDRPLLLGVAKMLSLSADDKGRAEATRLGERIDELFPVGG